MMVSIIIPNYNGEKLLKKNLPKVIAAAKDYITKNGKEAEVVIIDDKSEDNSIGEIENQKSTIRGSPLSLRLIQNEKNLGFSSSINKGVKSAHGSIVLLLNTDITPEKNFLIPLIRDFEKPEIFAVGCMDKSVENGKIVLRGRGIGKWSKGLFIHSRGEVNETNTLWINGGSGAFRKSIWEKLGGFDELYNPFYWEDIDLSYRALKSGFKILFEPKSVVVHEHEEGAINKKYSSAQIKKIAYRNQFIFIWKNITDSNLRLSHILWLPYYLLKTLMTGDLLFLFGFFSALLLLPKIIEHNLRDKTSFLKKDWEIFEEFEKEMDP